VRAVVEALGVIDAVRVQAAAADGVAVGVQHMAARAVALNAVARRLVGVGYGSRRGMVVEAGAVADRVVGVADIRPGRRETGQPVLLVVGVAVRRAVDIDTLDVAVAVEVDVVEARVAVGAEARVPDGDAPNLSVTGAELSVVAVFTRFIRGRLLPPPSRLRAPHPRGLTMRHTLDARNKSPALCKTRFRLLARRCRAGFTPAGLHAQFQDDAPRRPSQAPRLWPAHRDLTPRLPRSKT
jgi:hypothetical protein